MHNKSAPILCPPAAAVAAHQVEYWRRKIDELSIPVVDGASTSLGEKAVAPSRATSQARPWHSVRLADQPLSWEGTQSYAEENAKV